MFIFQPDRHLLRQFVATHAPAFSGKVLDVGGGPKRYAHLFSHCELVRLDIDPATQPDVVASAENLPFPDNSFDGVICSQVLGDVWDLWKAIDEMIRVVKPGKPILITESLFNEEHDEPHDYWRVTRFGWKKLLEGKTKIEILEQRGGFHSQIAQQKIRYRIEKYCLYQRPVLGRLMNVYATCMSKIALWRDSHAKTAADAKFGIGYCLLAVKK